MLTKAAVSKRPIEWRGHDRRVWKIDPNLCIGEFGSRSKRTGHPIDQTLCIVQQLLVVVHHRACDPASQPRLKLRPDLGWITRVDRVIGFASEVSHIGTKSMFQVRRDIGGAVLKDLAPRRVGAGESVGFVGGTCIVFPEPCCSACRCERTPFCDEHPRQFVGDGADLPAGMRNVVAPGVRRDLPEYFFERHQPRFGVEFCVVSAECVPAQRSRRRNVVEVDVVVVQMGRITFLDEAPVGGDIDFGEHRDDGGAEARGLFEKL